MEMKTIPEWIGDEEECLMLIGELASRHGYGNCIAHLMREWQVHLMRGGLPEKSARLAVMNREPYPLDYHKPRRPKSRAL